MDLIFFLAILAIFVCLFCVTTQATLYPGNTFNIDLLKKLIDKAYWYNNLLFFFKHYLLLGLIFFSFVRPIYGEMKILDEMNDKKTCLLTGNCPEPSALRLDHNPPSFTERNLKPPVCGKKFLSIIYTDKVEGKLGN